MQREEANKNSGNLYDSNNPNILQHEDHRPEKNDSPAMIVVYAVKVIGEL
jgi:hypothetical protein